MADKSLAVLANAQMELRRGEGGVLLLSGTLEAHHDSLIGGQKGGTLALSGELLVSGGNGQDVGLEIRLGNISVRGLLQLDGLTAEQILFLFGKAMPAACLNAPPKVTAA
ncbi:MAG: hypothetical protein AAB364_00710 [Patescibacteria group bacterium]